MSIEDQFTEQLPPDWQLSNLIYNDGTWQVNATDGEHVVIATGITISEALDNAYIKADAGEFIGKLFSLGRIESSEFDRDRLASLLAQLPPAPTVPFKRRF